MWLPAGKQDHLRKTDRREVKSTPSVDHQQGLFCRASCAGLVWSTSGIHLLCGLLISASRRKGVSLSQHGSSNCFLQTGLFSPSDKGEAAARIPCLESLNSISGSGLKKIYILEFKVSSNLFSSRIAQGTSDSFCSMWCIPESDGCSWCFTLAEFSVHNRLYFLYLRSHLEPWAASEMVEFYSRWIEIPVSRTSAAGNVI